VGDGRTLPFSSRAFDSVVSFLALQDVHMTGGIQAVSIVLQELLRILRQGGRLLIADNMFPDCVQTESERLYWTIQERELHASLPPKNEIRDLLRKFGATEWLEREFDTGISLDEKEARIELADIVESKPFGKTLEFQSIWQKYGSE